jgi:hypothetical protein
MMRTGQVAPVPCFEFEVTENRRNHARLPLRFPLRIRQMGGKAAAVNGSLVTENISSTGVYFLAPLQPQPNTLVELEIGLTDLPFDFRSGHPERSRGVPRGRERVRMRARARVVRVEPACKAGWHGLAATFDEMSFDRDGTAGVASGE